MGKTGRIQKVISSLQGRQHPPYKKDMSCSAIPKLNSPVALVSTDLILFLHQIPKKKNSF
jgi:hypothetical protein